jgi:rhamnulokinase
MNIDSSYVAVDLGAQSGRVILGKLHDRSKLEINEVRRFPNQMTEINGHWHWDINRLLHETKRGLKTAAESTDGMIASVGIDSWGVDYGLLDRHGRLIGMPYAYRDQRTEGMIDDFASKMPLRALYDTTGIQILPMNTLFQLYSMARQKSPALDAAADLLFIPDIFNYLLTGMKCTDFTYATTSQLFDPRANDWADAVLKTAGIKRSLLKTVLKPGTILTGLNPAAAADTGLNRASVVLVASHDTASAVAAVPAFDGDFAYISCGTWSLMGIEELKPIINEKTFRYNITNEGGICGTFRVLKNLNGLWLLEECQKKWTPTEPYDHERLLSLARGATAFRSIIDPDDPAFLNPEDMPEAIGVFCRRIGQPAPVSTGEYARCILDSLALSYRYTLESLRDIGSRRIARIHMIGGGSQNELLCQLTADATELPVSAGPREATAVGNILVQAMAADQVASLVELRHIVRESFLPVTYQPRNVPGMDKAYKEFLKIKRSSKRREDHA